MSIKIDHKGEDYYGIKVNGEYKEVALYLGEAIEGLLKARKEIDTTLKTLTE